jgi:hypothetical protein
MLGMTNYILVVGLNPSNTKTVFKAKANSTFHRLNKWFDLLGIKHYSFINIIHERGDYSNLHADYEFIRRCINNNCKVIALGELVSKVLSDINIDHFKMPHPSPRNRKINDKLFELILLILCGEYLNE